MNGIQESDISACFGDLKSHLAGNVQKVFVNTISKTEIKMQESFDKLRELYKVEKLLRVSSGESNHDNIADSSCVKAPFDEMVSDLKEKEKEQLRDAIQDLSGEVQRSKELLQNLKSLLLLELTAASDELQKMSIAATKCQNIMLRSN